MNAPTSLREVTLDDKYTLNAGRAFMTGTQAIVRLPMMQRERDIAAGLNTAGFITGYRGSPLGSVDQALWKAKAHLAEHHIKFQPGVNEDLAACRKARYTTASSASGTAKGLVSTAPATC
jgi:indolepyruvate ferredoxin oxidoreductase